MKSRPNPAQSWTIGELAAQFGLAAHVLRHWEDVGLLNPRRDPAGQRRYGDEERNRIAVIVRGKEAGTSLVLLREILDADPAQRRTLLERHHRDLEDRIAAIRESQRLSRHALDCEHGDFTTCPHFHTLVEQTIEGISTTSDA